MTGRILGGNRSMIVLTLLVAGLSRWLDFPACWFSLLMAFARLLLGVTLWYAYSVSCGTMVVGGLWDIALLLEGIWGLFAIVLHG
jgi:hypothetical protein